MKIVILATTALLFPTLLVAQQPAHPHKPEPPRAQSPRLADTSILIDENANLKSDLAQLRSMLNVIASQESGMDARSFAALQTNRQMWQVIIARLSELTQRIDALEQKQRSQSTGPAQAPQH